ncbi:MAG: RHS repeat protein [Betaproteobacteria bacterium]|nr:RHS repeat protein [Betaproteobacteria bacterium]
MHKRTRLFAACLLLAALPAAADIRVVTDGDPNGADDLTFTLPLAEKERLAELNLIEAGRETGLLASFQQTRATDGQLQLRLHPAIDLDRFADVKAELRARIAGADGATREWRQAIAIVPAAALAAPLRARQAVTAGTEQLVPVLPLTQAGNAQLEGVKGGPEQAALPYVSANGPSGPVAVVQTPLPYRLGEALSFQLDWRLSPGGKQLKQPVQLVPTALAEFNRDLDVPAGAPLAFEAGAAGNLAIEDVQRIEPQAASVLSLFDTAATPAGDVRFQLRPGQNLGDQAVTLAVQKRLDGRDLVTQFVRVAPRPNNNTQTGGDKEKNKESGQAAGSNTINAINFAPAPAPAIAAPAPAVEAPLPEAEKKKATPQRKITRRSGNRFAAIVGPATQFEYDAGGNRTRMIDPLGRATGYAYDALNRMVSSTDPAGGITALGYDALGRLATVTDPRGLTTAMTTDGLGNVTRLASPDSGTTQSAYDDAGNLVSRTDAKGQTTSYGYDALNRLTQASHADGSRTSYVYDQGGNGVGRLAGIEERAADGTLARVTRYAYDAQGRVTGETRTVAGIDYATRYRYAQGRLVGVDYPSGRGIDYGFDAAGRINELRLTDNGQTKVLASAVRYQPFGAVAGYANGAGATLNRSFDNQGRIQAVTLGGDTWQLTLDAASRITAQSNTGNPAASASYGYDALDRLTGAALPGATLGYGYDANGNRSQDTRGSVTNSYAIDPASNRVLSAAGATAKAYSYDANGSLTNDGQRQFSYDSRGRLTRAILAAASTGYEVNALGQRVRKRNGDTDTVFHYDLQGRLIAESAADGSRFRDYIWLGDLPLAVVQ